MRFDPKIPAVPSLLPLHLLRTKSTERSPRRVGLAPMECVPSSPPLKRLTLKIKLCETWPDPNPFPRFRLFGRRHR